MNPPSKTALYPDGILAKKPTVTPTAAPTGTTKPQQIIEEIAAEAAAVEVVEPEPAVVAGPDRSLSCKVDAGRYRRMGQARLDLSKTNQDILSEGLDLWLKKYKR